MKKLKFKRAQKNSAAHIMIFILGMLLLILISGCGRRDGETRENHILRLLREKYGEEFEILEESDHYNPFDLACPVGQKDKTFEVEYTIFGMTDAYYCVLMRDEYADRIETAVCEVFHENKMNVSFRATVHPNDTYSNRHSAKFEGVSFDKALKIESPVIKGMVLIMVKDNGGN